MPPSAPWGGGGERRDRGPGQAQLSRAAPTSRPGPALGVARRWELPCACFSPLSHLQSPDEINHMSQLQSISPEFKQQELSNDTPAPWPSGSPGRRRHVRPLLTAGKVGLGKGVWSQARKQSQGGLRNGGRPDSPPKAAGKKGHGWERSGRGRQGRKG